MLPALLATTRRRGWLPLALVAAHLALAFGVGAYEAWPPLDMPMHLAGGAIAAWFLAGWVERLELTRPALWVLALTAGAALSWELLENTADVLFAASWQLGLRDTTKDLVLGLLGCLVYLLLTRRAVRDSRPAA